jgi:thiol:disulfide interchange protein
MNGPLRGFLMLAVGLGLVIFLTSRRSGERVPPGEGIAWLTELEPALAQARETGRPIMVDFFATWCPPCKMLDAQTYSDSRVREASKTWIMVRIDVDRNKTLAQQYQISSIPTIVVLDSTGKETRRTTGFIPAEPMLSLLKS